MKISAYGIGGHTCTPHPPTRRNGRQVYEPAVATLSIDSQSVPMCKPCTLDLAAALCQAVSESGLAADITTRKFEALKREALEDEG